MAKKVIFTREDVMALLPHRPPFLFVDHVTGFRQHESIETERSLHTDEPYFAGHFPGMPVMPGVLVTDALAQTSGLLWGFSKKNDAAHTAAQPEQTQKEIFFLAAANIKYTNPAYPGDTLCMTSQAESNFGALYTYSVEAVVKRKVIAKGKLTLAMIKGTL
jgi:3-hydroxyacyl-[acyl-carrier-protein] dehydratase